MDKQIGNCKWCRRTGVLVYNQTAGVHNEECPECFAIYDALKHHPARQDGNCREALRLALDEITRHGENPA